MADFDDQLEVLPAGPGPVDEGLALDDVAPVVVEEQSPAPLGRSWVFDRGVEQFAMHGTRPQETSGLSTLLGWVDKFLHTQKGALAIHPPWFGMTDPMAMFGRPVAELSVGDLRRDLEDMTNHPNIADVVDVQLFTSPLDEAATLELTILTDPPTEDVDLLKIGVNVGVGVG